MAFKEHKGSLNENKPLQGRFCYRPFQLLEIHKEYYGFICCPSWLPQIVGNCKKTSVSEVWNSKKSQEIRRSIFDGSFKYCDHKECPEIQGDRLPHYDNLNPYWKKFYDEQKTEMPPIPSEIALCYDVSCNLSCPSCRTKKILDIRGKTFEEKLQFTNALVQQINQSRGSDQKIVLRVTGSGDPLAAPIYFKLLQDLDGDNLPHLKIILQTNGVLLTPQNWERLQKIHNNVSAISVSIDAASEATYEKVRRLGNWNKLQNNLRFISQIKERHKIHGFCLNFVVQKENYFEMADFVKMALDLGNVTEVFFSFVNNWHTWSRSTYEEQCIWKKNHKLFDDFMNHLKDPILGHKIVKLGNLTEYRRQALSRGERENDQFF